MMLSWSRMGGGLPSAKPKIRNGAHRRWITVVSQERGNAVGSIVRAQEEEQNGTGAVRQLEGSSGGAGPCGESPGGWSRPASTGGGSLGAATAEV
eukprot:6181967-Pleurochrysis_carterae.AAC.2